MKKILAHRYYRLGLTAAGQRHLNLALNYAECAAVIDPENDDAAHLAEICRYELGISADTEQVPQDVLNLIKKKRWHKAASLLRKFPCQNVRFLAMQGCLWALAKRVPNAVNCFNRVQEKDRVNSLAITAVAELKKPCRMFWRFF
ncbi:MAG: hypothetical protein Ta2B_09950 [Termitinemataceae bacterium]|nr:MAG: hypothetical protein Ta2B_09950 [Termitinemataceae bacterium]